MVKQKLKQALSAVMGSVIGYIKKKPALIGQLKRLISKFPVLDKQLRAIYWKSRVNATRSPGKLPPPRSGGAGSSILAGITQPVNSPRHAPANGLNAQQRLPLEAYFFDYLG
jgi:hypothetical protein